MYFFNFLDATPAAFSEDSQEAMNNSHSKEQPSKNITNAEVAEKNLPDLTGENWFALFYLAKKYFTKKYALSCIYTLGSEMFAQGGLFMK